MYIFNIHMDETSTPDAIVNLQEGIVNMTGSGGSMGSIPFKNPDCLADRTCWTRSWLVPFSSALGPT